MIAVAAAMVALAASAAVVFGQRKAPSGGSTAGGCPATNSAAIFTGQTYQFTRVRSAPTLASPVLRTIPAGCTVGGHARLPLEWSVSEVGDRPRDHGFGSGRSPASGPMRTMLAILGKAHSRFERDIVLNNLASSKSSTDGGIS